MTYLNLTTNELVMIEAYYQEKIKVSDIATLLSRSKQTIWVLKKMKNKKDQLTGLVPILRQ